jgi:phage terminase small subunit
VKQADKKKAKGPAKNGCGSRDAEGLTPFQRRFVAQYLITPNATEAYRRAGGIGVSSTLGPRMLKGQHVAAAVARAQEARAKRTEVTSDYVLTTIQQTVESAKVQGRHRDVLHGCELLGRHLGMWKDRVEHSGPNGGPIEERVQFYVPRNGREKQ